MPWAILFRPLRGLRGDRGSYHPTAVPWAILFRPLRGLRGGRGSYHPTAMPGAILFRPLRGLRGGRGSYPRRPLRKRTILRQAGRAVGCSTSPIMGQQANAGCHGQPSPVGRACLPTAWPASGGLQPVAPYNMSGSNTYDEGLQHTTVPGGQRNRLRALRRGAANSAGRAVPVVRLVGEWQEKDMPERTTGASGSRHVTGSTATTVGWAFCRLAASFRGSGCRCTSSRRAIGLHGEPLCGIVHNASVISPDSSNPLINTTTPDSRTARHPMPCEPRS